MVASCLEKDPLKRPSAEQLLKHRFFKWVKHPKAALEELLNGVPGPVQRLSSLTRRSTENILAVGDEAASYQADERVSLKSQKVCTAILFAPAGFLVQGLVLVATPSESAVCRDVISTPLSILRTLIPELCSKDNFDQASVLASSAIGQKRLYRTHKQLSGLPADCSKRWAVHCSLVITAHQPLMLGPQTLPPSI